MEADAHLQGMAVVGGEGVHGRLHRQRRPDRLFRVILAGFVYAPEGHHGVADMFVDTAVVGKNDLVHPPPQGVDRLLGVLGVHRFDHGREAGDVGEEDGDLFALLIGVRDRVQGGQLGLDPGDGGGNGRVPQRVPSRFQGDDGFLQFLLLAHSYLPSLLVRRKHGMLMLSVHATIALFASGSPRK